MADAAVIIERALSEAGIDWESPEPGTYVAKLPGTRKLFTTVSLVVGAHTLSLNAFVVRHPDENAEGVYRWVLERNLRLYGVAFALDPLGDVYLVGRVPLAAVTPGEVDRLLGSVLDASDGAFNTLLELGFATSIRREYAWRVSRGESTRNLDAFTHLTRDVPAPDHPTPAPPPPATDAVTTPATDDGTPAATAARGRTDTATDVATDTAPGGPGRPDPWDGPSRP